MSSPVSALKELLLLILKESRDRLYFDQWQYAFCFYQSQVHSLRNQNADSLLQLIEFRTHGFAWQHRYTTDVVQQLINTQDHISRVHQPFKFMVSGSWGTIYTNSTTVIDQFLQDCVYVSSYRIKQAIVDRPRDTVLLNNPVFAIRSYFKSQHCPGNKLASLQDFFAAQPDDIKPSPGMQFMLNRGGMTNHWIHDYYYVDYNNPAYATMLSLIMTRAFRKTVSIVQRINS